MKVIELLREILKKNLTKVEAYKNIYTEMDNICGLLVLEENQAIILSEPTLLLLIQNLISIHARQTLKNTNYQLFMVLSKIYYRNNDFSEARMDLMEVIFKYLQPRADYIDGLKFFSSICSNLNSDKFFIEMAFAMFFAYQLKNFNLVENILNFHFLNLNNLQFDYIKYYCMYFFYQGHYFLAQRDFERAALSFCSIMSLSNSKTYNIFQIEAMKRLAFLKYIVNRRIKDIISKHFKENDDLLKAFSFEAYSIISSIDDSTNVKLHVSQEKNKNDINSTLKKYEAKIKEDKLWGLAKIASLHENFKKFKDFVYPFCRISINDVVEGTGLNKKIILNIIHKFNSTKQINIKIDQQNDTLEINNINPDKEYYNEKLVNYNKNVSIFSF